MNVLSLFDGMSCGRIALERADIPVSHYFASEVDRYAIEVSKDNYPDIIRLGDVTEHEGWNLPKIDLLVGGSPCQGFSFAGKQLNFDDPRSALFFQYVEILRECLRVNPNVKFLLENVNMKKEYLAEITRILGVEPIKINSSLVSAQNRVRWYWTNIDGVGQPEDQGIFLPDILEGTVGLDHLLSEGQINRLKTSSDLTKSFSKIDPDKAGAMTARQYANWKGTFVSCRSAAIVGRRFNSSGTRDDYNTDLPKIQTLEVGDPGVKSRCLSTVSKDTLVSGLPPGKYKNAYKDLEEGQHYRKLTLVECERLQTVPDGYTAAVSNTQRYKMLGNGWTVDVVAHILKHWHWFLE